MGVYIKGIEMPKSGRYTVIKIFDSGDWYAEEKDFFDDKNVERHYKFEAVTNIEEPHGRLIDADALLDKLRPRWMPKDVWEESSTYKDIANAPTIIEGSDE